MDRVHSTHSASGSATANWPGSSGLEGVVANESAADYAKQSFKQFVEIFRGKEGLISEVKDFLAVLYLLELRIAADHPGLARASEGIYKYTPFR